MVFSLCLIFLSQAQDSSRFDKAISFPDKFFGALSRKTSSIEQKLNKQTDRYLNRLQRQENKLRKKLHRKDSTLAEQLFAEADQKYDRLKQLSDSPAMLSLSKYQSLYSGHLDSLSTALGFLKDQNITDNPSLQKTLTQYRDLQQRLNASEQIRKQLLDREQILKEQLQKTGLVKELKKFRKQVYYYQAQIKEYKNAFEDPSKLEAKLMEVVMKLPQFRDFFAKNSLLGSLFALPTSTTNSTALVTGLQSRQMINQSLISRFGTSASITQQLQQNMQNAQGQLNQLKGKLSSFTSGNYGNGDADMPDFKPNGQRTKSFFGRMEYGGDVQSQRARYFFPVTSDLAVSIGYKLNDKSSIGVGASYKIGWGNNWSNIKLTNQGVGLRSYIDWKIKGSFFVSGGYEQNYRSMINSIDQLRNYSAWQSSGLIGLSKKYQVSKKIKGQLKLLWDFLSYDQIPKAQPFVFRVGYNFK